MGWSRVLWAALGGGVLAAGLGVLVHRVGGPLPEDAAVEVMHTRAPLALRPGGVLRVLSWNIQFSGSRRYRFFYDGGSQVHVPADVVDETVLALAAAVRQERPDLLLLQELDRDSARTARRDQLYPLLSAAGGAEWVTAPYHRARFVPYPFPRMLGRVDMHLAIVSRFPLRSAQRIPLPMLDEHPLRQRFNLRRAILTAEVPVEGGLPLAVAVTHLSAFSHGDGTMPRQVEVLRAWMAERQARGQPFVLAGDLNLLPPGDDAARLEVQGDLYPDRPNPMERLVPEFRTAFPPEALLEEANRTYLPFGMDRPDRKIDWVFTGPGVEILDARVLHEYHPLSDHLPLRVDLRLTEPRDG